MADKIEIEKIDFSFDSKSAESRNYLNSKKNKREGHNRRSRSESPPPKKYRDKCGINRGKANCCSYCRPEYSTRIEKVANTRMFIRNFKKNNYIY